MIYLDNAATTFPKPACVWDAVDRYNRTAAVNAGRGAYATARSAGEMIRRVRAGLVSLCDAREQAQVVLTPSVTIALNQIIFGAGLCAGSVAYVTPYEHNAVLRPLEILRRRGGVRVVELPLAQDLSIDLDATERMFREVPPDLVCVTAVSNVTGYVLPAREIFTLARRYGAFTVLDAAQAMGLIRIRFADVRADAITFAGHKTLYAPFGVAGFLLRNGRKLECVLAGGNGIRSLSLEMPRTAPERYECGSMNTPAIAGLGASLEWLRTVQVWQRERELMDYLIPRLEAIPGVTLYRAPQRRLQAAVISFNVQGFRANEVGAILDKSHDIAVRAGHHCAALIHDHLKDKVYDGTVRVSASYFTTEEDLDALIDALSSIDREDLKEISTNVLRGNC